MLGQGWYGTMVVEWAVWVQGCREGEGRRVK